MGINLGCNLKEFVKKWEKSYLSHKGSCPYHDIKFKEDWIPLACVSYAPALNRLINPKNLTKKLVGLLKNNGKIIFRENLGVLSTDTNKVLEAVKELTLNNTGNEIDGLILDYGFSSLMIDRNAYTTYGDQIGVNVQFYIKKK